MGISPAESFVAAANIFVGPVRTFTFTIMQTDII